MEGAWWLPAPWPYLALGALSGSCRRGDYRLGGWLAVPMLIGIAIGRHGFARVSEAQFRRAVLIVLAIVATAGLARALWALVSS